MTSAKPAPTAAAAGACVAEKVTIACRADAERRSALDRRQLDVDTPLITA